jgi:hypothetical protein
MKALMLAVSVTFGLPGAVLAQAADGLHIYDSAGHVVGNYLPSIPCINPKGVPCNGLAILTTPSTPVVLPVSPSGIHLALVHQLNVPQFFHASPDCSGPRFVGDTGTSIDGFFPPVAIGTANKVIVPINPLLRLSVQSVETFDGNPGLIDFTQPGTCAPSTGPSNAVVYFVVTVDASLFGTPPFSVR